MLTSSHTRDALSAGSRGARSRTGSRRERRRGGAKGPLLLVQPADHLQPRRHILNATRRLPPPQSAGRNAVLCLCVCSPADSVHVGCRDEGEAVARRRRGGAEAAVRLLLRLVHQLRYLSLLLTPLCSLSKPLDVGD